MLYQRTDVADVQRLRYSRDPDSVYIAVDGPRNANGDPCTLPGTSLNGWTVTLISKNCQHPDQAIKLMSFLMGEEGQKLIALGVEGEHYTMENGRAVLTGETARLLNEDNAAYVAQVGANDIYWMLQDNLMQSKWLPLNEPVIRQMEEWTFPYTVYTGQYGTSFAPGSEADAADQRVTAIHGEMLPRLLRASSQAEFEELWEEYVRRREEAGLALVLEESTRQMIQAKARLGLE